MTILQFMIVYGFPWFVGIGSIAIMVIGGSTFTTLLGVVYLVMSVFFATTFQDGIEICENCNIGEGRGLK